MADTRALAGVTSLLQPSRSDSERIAGLLLIPRILIGDTSANTDTNSTTTEADQAPLSGEEGAGSALGNGTADRLGGTLRAILVALCASGDDFLDRLMFQYLYKESESDQEALLSGADGGLIVDGNGFEVDGTGEVVGVSQETTVFVTVALKLLNAVVVNALERKRSSESDGIDGGGDDFVAWLSTPVVRKVVLRKVRFAWTAVGLQHDGMPVGNGRDDVKRAESGDSAFDKIGSDWISELALGFLAAVCELWPESVPYVRRSAHNQDWCHDLALLSDRIVKFVQAQNRGCLPVVARDHALTVAGSTLLCCAGLHMVLASPSVQEDRNHWHECADCFIVIKSVFTVARSLNADQFQLDVLRLSSILISVRGRALGPMSPCPSDWADDARLWLSVVLRSKQVPELQLRQALEAVAAILDVLNSGVISNHARGMSWLLKSDGSAYDATFLLTILARVHVEVYISLDRATARLDARADGRVLHACGRLMSHVTRLLFGVDEEGSEQSSSNFELLEQAFTGTQLLNLRDIIYRICDVVLDHFEALHETGSSVEVGLHSLLVPIFKVLVGSAGDADRGPLGPSSALTGEKLRRRCLEHLSLLIDITQMLEVADVTRESIFALLVDFSGTENGIDALFKCNPNRFRSLVATVPRNSVEEQNLASLLLNLCNAAAIDASFRRSLKSALPQDFGFAYIRRIVRSTGSQNASILHFLAGLAVISHDPPATVEGEVCAFLAQAALSLCDRGTVEDLREALFLIWDSEQLVCCALELDRQVRESFITLVRRFRLEQNLVGAEEVDKFSTFVSGHVSR